MYEKLTINQANWLVENIDIWHDNKHFVLYDNYGNNSSIRLVVCTFEQGTNNYPCTFVSTSGAITSGRYQLNSLKAYKDKYIYCDSLVITDFYNTSDVIIADSNVTVGLPEKHSHFALPYTLRAIPARSGGNYTDENGQQWICDEVDFERCVYIQRVGISDIKDITLNPVQGANNVFILSGKAVKKFVKNASANISKIMCAYFGNDGYAWVSKENCISWSGGTNKQLRICTENQEDVVNFINSNGIQILCALEESVETPLTADQIATYKALTTHKTTTLISNDAGADMEVSYVADPKTYIDNKFVELSQALIASASEAE